MLVFYSVMTFTNQTKQNEKWEIKNEKQYKWKTKNEQTKNEKQKMKNKKWTNKKWKTENEKQKMKNEKWKTFDIINIWSFLWIGFFDDNSISLSFTTLNLFVGDASGLMITNK